jgi:hypothetical protein
MGLLTLLIPIVAIISVFTFVAVASWSENRRKERETYYRHETYRKIMESPGSSTQAVVRLMRQEEMQQQRRRLEGLRLGGLITFVVGIGVMVFLYALIPDEAVYLAGVIPVLIGSVLIVYGFFLAGKPTDQLDPDEPGAD